MTPHASARRNAVWTLRVLATFFVFGGFIGGLVVGLGFPLLAIITQTPPSFDPAWIVQIPFLALFAAAYGIAIGLPSSLLTGAAYLIGRQTMRRRWRLTAFGSIASALWGAILADLMSPFPTPLESYAFMAALFAMCGAIATIGCFWLLVRWGLHRPD